MKLICRNPEELIHDVNTIGYFGKGSIISRINLGKTEYEEDLANTIIKICRDKVEGIEEDADLKTILNVESMNTMRLLKNVFTIEGFEKTSDGEDVVVVSYITYEKLKEKNNSKDIAINNQKLYAQMKEIYDKDTYIPYADSEIEDIVKEVIDKYISDMKSRGNIIFERKFGSKKYLDIGGGVRYFIKPLEYFVNGERIRVYAIIKSSSFAEIEPPQNQFPNEEGSLDIKVIRVAKNGEEELICSMKKDVDIEEGFGTSHECEIRGKKYSTTDKKTAYKPTLISISEIFSGKKIENKIPSEETFREFASGLIVPEKIDELKDIIWEKTRFIAVDKKVKSNYELSDWPENLKKQTIQFEPNKGIKTEDKVETLNQKINYSQSIRDDLENIIIKILFDYYFRESIVGPPIKFFRLFSNTSIYVSIIYALEGYSLTEEERKALEDIKQLYDEGMEGAIITEALIIIIRAIRYNDEEIAYRLHDYGMNIELYQGIEIDISSYVYGKYQGLLVSKTQFYEFLETPWGEKLMSELDDFLIKEFMKRQESGKNISRLKGREAKLYANRVSKLGLIPSNSMLIENQEFEYPSSSLMASKK